MKHLFKAFTPGIFTFAGDEGNAGGGEGNKGGEGKSEIKKAEYTQEQIDAIVEGRLRREREKFSDYDDLKKFREQYEKETEEKKKKNLEEQQKYEELKKQWEQEKQNYNKALNEKETMVKTLKIDHALSGIINQMNAYPEAAQVIKNEVVMDDNGDPKMRSKDSVGNEVLVSLEEGVKKFLNDRPYLVRSKSQNGGGGTPPAGGGGEGQGADSLDDLNRQLMEAQKSGNALKVKELKAKVNAHLASKGVSRYI